MKIIPFRIKGSEDEDNFSDIYEFLIKGSNKDAYIIEIFIDDANDLGITFESCTCPHHKFRQAECKHIELAKKILRDFKVIPIMDPNAVWKEVGSWTFDKKGLVTETIKDCELGGER